ncbi:MAG: GTPase ObgE [Gemmatimonadota bacterium]|nr:GTPase ObgE [Gemmatimonadota bacterium]
MFVDLATVRVTGGAGGAGASAFRREIGVPRGGPAGGNGGRGGDVVLVADPTLDTLLDFSYREHYKAGRAGHGEGKKREGADGKDLVLPVPLGTVVKDADSGERVGELLEEGDRLVVAKGGRGGRGNASFASPTNQAPRNWEPGEWGEERRVTLELKLIADVGLVGEPNAGKSTLLSRVTAATPKVADYPFTTLKPNLGVVDVGDGRSFVVADIPGLIEGAHEGRGLGAQFLRHIERTRTLAVLVPFGDPDPQGSYDLLRRELVSHDLALGSLPHCVIRTKADLTPAGERDGNLDAPEAWGQLAISSVTGEGLAEAIEALWAAVRDEKARAAEGTPDPFEGVEEWRP